MCVWNCSESCGHGTCPYLWQSQRAARIGIFHRLRFWWRLWYFLCVSVSLHLCMCVHTHARVFTQGYVYVLICPLCSFSSLIYIYHLEYGYNIALIPSVLITMVSLSQIPIADGIVSLKLVQFLILHTCNNYILFSKLFLWGKDLGYVFVSFVWVSFSICRLAVHPAVFCPVCPRGQEGLAVLPQNLGPPLYEYLISRDHSISL